MVELATAGSGTKVENLSFAWRVCDFASRAGKVGDLGLDVNVRHRGGKEGR